MYTLHITLDKNNNVFIINITNKCIELNNVYYLYNCSISKDEYDNLLLSSSLLINTTNCIMEIMLTKYFILSCYEIKCGVKSKITIALNSDEKKQFIRELKKLYQLKPNIS